MLEDVEKALSSLASVAKDLNSASDSLTAALRSLEERLAALKLGVAVFLESPLDLVTDVFDNGRLGETDDDPIHYSGIQHFLGYGKLGGAWRLLVKCHGGTWFGYDESCVQPGVEFSQGADEAGRKPLLDSSRDIRLAAASELNSLLALIEKAARERVESLNAVVASVAGSTKNDSTSVAPDSRRADNDPPMKFGSKSASNRRRSQS